MTLPASGVALLLRYAHPFLFAILVVVKDKLHGSITIWHVLFFHFLWLLLATALIVEFRLS